jgi:hypothetical protein
MYKAAVDRFGIADSLGIQSQRNNETAASRDESERHLPIVAIVARRAFCEGEPIAESESETS